MRIRRTTIRIAGVRTYPKLAEQVRGSRPCLRGLKFAGLQAAAIHDFSALTNVYRIDVFHAHGSCRKIDYFEYIVRKGDGGVVTPC